MRLTTSQQRPWRRWFSKKWSTSKGQAVDSFLNSAAIDQHFYIFLAPSRFSSKLHFLVLTISDDCSHLKVGASSDERQAFISPINFIHSAIIDVIKNIENLMIFHFLRWWNIRYTSNISIDWEYLKDSYHLWGIENIHENHMKSWSWGKSMWN